MRTGALAGAIASFLLWLTAAFMLYGISNVGNVMGILVEPVVEAVLGAVTGGLVAALFRKMSSASTQGSGAESGRTDKAAA